MCTLIFSQCWNFLKKEGHLKKFFQDSQCINTSVKIVIYAISVYTFLVDVSGSHIASRRLSNVPQCCIKNSSCVECMSYWTVVLLSNVQFSQTCGELQRRVFTPKPSRALALLQSWVASHSVILSRCNSPPLCSWQFSRPPTKRSHRWDLHTDPKSA